jgi:hypothetical protein
MAANVMTWCGIQKLCIGPRDKGTMKVGVLNGR